MWEVRTETTGPTTTASTLPIVGLDANIADTTVE
jgi:hypothetical protein